MSLPDTPERIQSAWNIRKELIRGILARGDTLVESLKLIPEARESFTFERWQKIVSDEVAAAVLHYGNGDPILSGDEILKLALITSPTRGW